MPRDPRLYLSDILEGIARIREYTKNIDFNEFTMNRMIQDAVVRNLEIIGEAPGRLPETMKDKASEIEWRKITALRNILAHEYFGVSLPIVWDIIQNKLEPLQAACAMLFEDVG